MSKCLKVRRELKTTIAPLLKKLIDPNGRPMGGNRHGPDMPPVVSKVALIAICNANDLKKRLSNCLAERGPQLGEVIATVVHNCTQTCKFAKLATAMMPATGVFHSHDGTEGDLGVGHNHVAKTMFESVRQNGVLAYNGKICVQDVTNNTSLNITNLRNQGDT